MDYRFDQLYLRHFQAHCLFWNSWKFRNFSLSLNLKNLSWIILELRKKRKKTCYRYLNVYYGPAPNRRGIKRCFCLTSVAYIGPKSRTERPRKTKVGKEVAHITRDSNTTFQVKRSMSPGRFGWLFKSLHDLYGRHHNHNQSGPLPVNHEYSWRKARWALQA